MTSAFAGLDRTYEELKLDKFLFRSGRRSLGLDRTYEELKRKRASSDDPSFRIPFGSYL